jgi:Kef-type K+ transport system membrane component KefB
VLARILDESGLLSTEIGAIAIACAAFDDVSGWMILAAVMSLVRAGDPGVLLVHVVLFVGYLAIMLLVIRPTLVWWARKRGAEFCQSADDLVVVFLIVLPLGSGD